MELFLYVGGNVVLLNRFSLTARCVLLFSFFIGQVCVLKDDL